MSRARRIIIGDVHGHYEGLMSLLKEVNLSASDQVYFLGDLIDRGPQSAQVVKFVKESGYQCLLGNHEQMLLDAFADGEIYTPALQAWLYSGGNATVNSYGEQGISPEDIEWIKTLPKYLDLGDIWLVHAGVDPRIPLEQQNQEQFCWIREDFHAINKPFFSEKLIITGHTITFTLPGVIPGNLALGYGWLDIETGAYHPKSGWLTALDINNRLVYQVNVIRRRIRTLPLEEVITRVEPNQITSRRKIALP